MTDSFEETKRELYELLRNMRREAYLPPTPDKLTPTEAGVLMMVAEFQSENGRARPGEVAESLRTTPSALSQTLGTLQKKGLIERNRIAGNSRAVTITLTPEGSKLAHQVISVHDNYMQGVAEYLGAQDLRQMLTIMKKIAAYHTQLISEGKLQRFCQPDETGHADASTEAGVRRQGDASCT